MWPVLRCLSHFLNQHPLRQAPGEGGHGGRDLTPGVLQGSQPRTRRSRLTGFLTAARSPQRPPAQTARSRCTDSGVYSGNGAHLSRALPLSHPIAPSTALGMSTVSKDSSERLHISSRAGLVSAPAPPPCSFLTGRDEAEAPPLLPALDQTPACPAARTAPASVYPVGHTRPQSLAWPGPPAFRMGISSTNGFPLPKLLLPQATRLDTLTLPPTQHPGCGAALRLPPVRGACPRQLGGGGGADTASASSSHAHGHTASHWARHRLHPLLGISLKKTRSPSAGPRGLHTPQS